MKKRENNQFNSTLRSNPHCTNLPPEVWSDMMGWKINDNIILVANEKDDTIIIRKERRVK
jgi:hypothetical protein